MDEMQKKKKKKKTRKACDIYMDFQIVVAAEIMICCNVDGQSSVLDSWTSRVLVLMITRPTLMIKWDVHVEVRVGWACGFEGLL